MAKTEQHERPTLEKAAELGKAGAGDKAKFLGWQKAHGARRVMVGRFDNGTVVYRSKNNAWVFGKAT